MLSFILVTIGFSIFFSCSTSVDDRSKFAYQALLLYKGAPFCSGAIIDEKHVLTAAKCLKPKSKQTVESSDVTVAVGNLDLFDVSNIKEVESIFIHHDYGPGTLLNDIAVVRVSGNFDITSDVQPISLQGETVTDGKCNISGWGTNYYNLQNDLKNELDFVEVPVINEEECVKILSSTNIVLRGNVICAGRETKDSCQGDSGSPLVCVGELSGIVSSSVGCAYNNIPGIYTDVAKYTEWIKEQTQRQTPSFSMTITGSCMLLILTTMIHVAVVSP